MCGLLLVIGLRQRRIQATRSLRPRLRRTRQLRVVAAAGVVILPGVAVVVAERTNKAAGNR